MSIFDVADALILAPEKETKESIQAYNVGFNFCLYCTPAQPLSKAAKRQLCRFHFILYGFMPDVIREETRLSAENSDPIKDPIESKEAKYSRIFNHVKGQISADQMSDEAIALRLRELETALAELMFEKRTEITAYADELHGRLEQADDIKREKIRKIDKEYTAKHQRAEGEKIVQRHERMDKREQFIQKMMKAGIKKETAEEMAKNIK